MIEIIGNALQFSILSACLIYCVLRLQREESDNWFLLCCFYCGYLLGQIYWLVHLIFYRDTPAFLSASELSWVASHLFLIILLRTDMSVEERRYRSPYLCVIPIFCIALCLFFFQWGEYLFNIVCCVIMCILGISALKGVLFAGRKAELKKRKMLCSAGLVLFVVLYGLWVVSCYWEGNTFDPYFILDVCYTFSLASFAVINGREVAT